MNSAITLDALKVLDAIDKRGSFAAAAASLYRVPSALTYTVQKLEQDLGCRLFTRKGTRAQLTEVGQLVLTQGRDILMAATRLENAVHQLETGWETTVALALDTVLDEAPLLKVIDQFTELGKQVDIHVTKESLGGGWDALYSGRADIAIGVSGELPRGQYELFELGMIEFVFAVAPDHPLAQYDAEIPTEALLQFPSIIVADSSQSLSQRSNGIFASRQQIRLSSMADKVRLQQQGTGVGFLPRHMIRQALDEGSLVSCQVALPRPPQPFYMAWRKGDLGKARAWFIEQLKQQCWLD